MKTHPPSGPVTSRLQSLAARAEPTAYALLRLALGAILLTHGWPKALHAAHGSMADPMAATTHLIRDVVGLPFAPQLATLVMLLETVGAALLAVGLGTRVVAALFVLEMAGISVALGPAWPWIDRGIEYPVLLGSLAAYIAVRGDGPWALASAIPRRAGLPASARLRD